MGKLGWAIAGGVVGLIGGPGGAMAGAAAGLTYGAHRDRVKARRIPGGDELFKEDRRRLDALQPAAVLAQLQPWFAKSAVTATFGEVEARIEKRHDQEAAQAMQQMVRTWRILLVTNEAAFNYSIDRVHKQKADMLKMVKEIQSRHRIKVGESEIARRHNVYKFSDTFVYPKFAESHNMDIAKQFAGANTEIGKAFGRGDNALGLLGLAIVAVGAGLQYSRNKRILEDTLGKVRLFHAEVEAVMGAASAGMDELTRLSSLYAETIAGLQSNNTDHLQLYVAQGLALERVKGIAA